jgi:hypothetical protein
VLDVGPVLELLDQRQQRAIDDQRAVARVLGDVADVARVEAQVQRVQDEPAAGNPEVGLEVLVVVPAERRHAVAALQPQLLQPDGELP